MTLRMIRIFYVVVLNYPRIRRMNLLKAVFLSIVLASIACNALANDKFKVVTTFTVIADMARNVAGDAAVVESITKPGAEIHGYQPTPRDIIRAQDADLILWNGMNLELWFEQFFRNLEDAPSITLSDGVKPWELRKAPIPASRIRTHGCHWNLPLSMSITFGTDW